MQYTGTAGINESGREGRLTENGGSTMKRPMISAAALAVIMLLGGCNTNNVPAASETTTVGSLTTTSAAAEQTTTTAAAMTEETTASDTSETAAEPAPVENDFFTPEDYGWVMKNVPHSLLDMRATAGGNSAFILHVDTAQLGEDSEIVFCSLDKDDMIYGEYIVDVRKAADPAVETLPSEIGEDIVAVPVPLRDILNKDDLDIAQIAKFYITKNVSAIKQITIAPYIAPQKGEAQPEYSDEMIARMSERYYEYFTGNKPVYPNYEHFYTDDTVTSVYNVPPAGDRVNPITTIYTIDKKTAKGEDQNGNPVDLTQFRDGTPSDPDEPETYETGSFAYQRRLMKFEDALFGVRFVGFDNGFEDLKGNESHLIETLNSTGTGEEFGLYIGYPKENIVQTEDGWNIFFIIPRSNDCKVEVKMKDDESNVLYSGNGAPIILKCNDYRTTKPECIVYITDPDGKTVSWCPETKGIGQDHEDEGHRLKTVHPDGLIHDFSDYNNRSGMG